MCSSAPKDIGAPRRRCGMGSSQRPGQGIVDDVKRTLGTHWRAEMSNFNQKTVAVSFFVFFACIAPAITFGAMYSKFTHYWIGPVEMIAATAWCGILYAIIGGQPMMINGGTGPVLAFTAVLYNLSETLEVPFLTLNAWTGIWVGLYMALAAVFGTNKYIMYCTRFTDEIFSTLISVIFIVNSLGSPTSDVGLYYYFLEEHKSHDKHRVVTGEGFSNDYSHLATALLSTVTTLGTCWLAMRLRSCKQSAYLPGPRSRALVTDFAVVASILTWTLIDHFALPKVKTERLAAPDTFAPTYTCCTAACNTHWPEECTDVAEAAGRRPWLVDLGDLNGKGWVPFFAAVPALLAFILVFLDDGITWHLINRPDNKLTHGDAYHWDTLVIGAFLVVNSLFGLPWLVAATVRSINHVQAMAEKDAKGRIVSVQQTRLTHFFIHLLVLVSIFAMQAVRQIPVPVLYGVFLYMGIASLSGNQFFERILLLGMEPSLYPRHPFTDGKKVPRRKLHAYTVLQLGLFALLYVVKGVKSIAIAFPLVIAACIPIRLFLLPRLFSKDELEALDGDDSHAPPAAVEPTKVELQVAGDRKTPMDNSGHSVEDVAMRCSPSATNLLTEDGVPMPGASPEARRQKS